MPVLAYFDVVILVVAAPIMILIGVPADGYAIGAGAWIALRALGIPVERYAAAGADLRQTTSIRLMYMLGRLFALALAVIVARNAGGRNSGLTCLAVIAFAFTISLATSSLTRPRRTSRPRPAADPTRSDQL
jgi:hypothetical protein